MPRRFDAIDPKASAIAALRRSSPPGSEDGASASRPEERRTGPRMMIRAGIRLSETAKAARTPKLAKKPNSRMGRTAVKQKEAKPAKVVSAASITGHLTLRSTASMRRLLPSRSRAAPPAASS